MNLSVSYNNKRSTFELPVEFVERKGKAHPDSICDMAAEESSLALCEYFLKKYNRIYHHNIDKAVLAGGQSNVRFGGGEIIEPIYLLLVGRAAREVNGEIVPVDELVINAVKERIKKEIRFLKPDLDIKIDTKIRKGSADLIGNFERGVFVPLSNDTSFGVGFAPLTATEQITLKIEEHLNSKKIKEEYPAIGEDIKVMSVRVNDELKITIACAFISKFINNETEYMNYKNIVKKEAEYVIDSLTKMKHSVAVNNADDFKSKLFYLTVTGTSAEHGDDGQVGRGNRANGLITPFRPMTLEATAGKNPISHTGKLYTIASQIICNKIINECEDVKDVYCYMVSRIGDPITEPKMVHVEIIPYKKGPDEGTVESIVKETVSNIPLLWKDIIERKIRLF